MLMRYLNKTDLFHSNVDSHITLILFNKLADIIKPCMKRNVYQRQISKWLMCMEEVDVLL